MDSFLEKIEAANKQRQEQAQEKEDAIRKEKERDRVESLDEMVNPICEVVKAQILKNIEQGSVIKKTETRNNGLFKPKTTIELEFALGTASIQTYISPLYAISTSGSRFIVIKVREKHEILALWSKVIDTLKADKIWKHSYGHEDPSPTRYKRKDMVYTGIELWTFRYDLK